MAQLRLVDPRRPTHSTGNHQAHREIPIYLTAALTIQSKIDQITAQLDNVNLSETKILSLTSDLVYQTALLTDLINGSALMSTTSAVGLQDSSPWRNCSHTSRMPLPTGKARLAIRRSSVHWRGSKPASVTCRKPTWGWQWRRPEQSGLMPTRPGTVGRPFRIRAEWI